MTSAAPACLIAIVTMASSPAQGVTVKATALTELRVESVQISSFGSSSESDALPAGTDITNGAGLSVAQELFHEGASLSFTTRYEPSRITIDLNERARGRAASFGLVYAGSVGPHQIRVEWSSPRPIHAKLIVRHCRNSGSIPLSYLGRVDVLNHGSVSGDGSIYTASNCFGGGFQINETFDVVIDSSPLVAVFDTEGSARGSNQGNESLLRANWRLELVPDPTFPCEIESYGDSCGATLAATTDFDHPGQLVISLDDPSLPQVGALTLGSTRASTPIIGTACTLYHNLQVFLFPWPVDGNGRAEVVFTPPPIPGLSFKMQAATLRGMTIHATNGLDVLVCH